MLLKIVMLLRKLESQHLFLFFSFSFIYILWFEGIHFCCWLLDNIFASNHGKCPLRSSAKLTLVSHVSIYSDVPPGFIFFSCRKIKIVRLCCTCCFYNADLSN